MTSPETNGSPFDTNQIIADLFERIRLLGGVGEGKVVYNVKAYGAKGDGSANDTAAIEAAIADMPTVPGTFNGSAGILYFPEGRYMTDGGHVIPNNKRMKIMGAGPYVSIINQRAGATADMLTIRASTSGVSNLTLNGVRGGISGDLLVLDAAYTYAEVITTSGGPGNAIVVGKTASAIAHRLRAVNIRGCKGYGVQVVGGSSSTDGQWSQLDVGQTGLSGVRISNGAQNLFDVHVWGCGLESTTDKHGIWLDSSSNVLIGCQSETNLGAGIHVGGDGSEGNQIVGGKIWGNAGNGIYGFKSNRNTIVGAKIYNNGINNTAGSNSTSFAGIMNDGGVDWLLDCYVYDDGKVVNPGTYSGYTPTYPFPGRAASTYTHSYSYAEGSGADYNRISGMMRKERTRTGLPILNVGIHNNYSGCQFGDIAIPTVAAAATVTLPAHMDFVNISGTTQITSINASYPGRLVTLVFTDAAPGGMLDGTGTLRLAGNFAPGQNGSITLRYSGSAWHEVARSAN